MRAVARHTERHAQCSGHKHYYDVLLLPRKEGFGKGQREAPFLTIGRKYRNPFEAQEILYALRRGAGADGSMPKQRARQPTQPFHHSHTMTFTRPSNTKWTMTPTCTNASQQHGQSSEAKPATLGMTKETKHYARLGVASSSHRAQAPIDY